MRPGIALRPDYDAAQLWALAKASRNAGQSRRLLALAEIYDGGSRTRAARIGGVGLQSVRDWVVRFNAHGPGGLIDGKAPGNARKLNESQRRALVNIVESGPMPAIHGVVRWRLKDLIPTRVKADSLWGFQTGASQTLWWRAGGSPCGQGLRFAQTMMRPGFGHWRKRAGTRGKVGGCWRWPRSTMAAPGPKRRGAGAAGCSRFGTGLCGSTPTALTD